MIKHIFRLKGLDAVKWLATGWMTEVRFPADVRIHFSAPHPDRLWGSPRLLFKVLHGIFTRRKVAGKWSWPFTTIHNRIY